MYHCLFILMEKGLKKLVKIMTESEEIKGLSLHNRDDKQCRVPSPLLGGVDVTILLLLSNGKSSTMNIIIKCIEVKYMYGCIIHEI